MQTPSKSGKTFLKSLETKTARAAAIAGFLGSAALWDYATTQDPSDVKNWGLTALMIAVIAKDAAARVASYQKAKG